MSSKLQNYLNEHKITQADFAKQIGSTQGYVSKLCRDDAAEPSLAVAIAIENATNGKVKCGSWVKKEKDAVQEQSVSGEAAE